MSRTCALSANRCCSDRDPFSMLTVPTRRSRRKNSSQRLPPMKRWWSRSWRVALPKFDHDIYLVAAVRTPIGRFGGGMASLTAPQLGVAAAKATLERSGVDPAAVDEVIFGNARQAGVGPNAARQIAVRSGLRHEVPAYTVNQ